MEPLIELNGQVNGTVQTRQIRRQMASGTASIGSQIKGPCSVSRPDEEQCQHRRPGKSIRPAASQRRTDWTTDTFLKAPGGLPKGRRSLRHRKDSARQTQTLSIPRAPFSRRLARNWSTARATSRSRPTRCGRLSNSTRSLSAFLHRTSGPGTTPATTSGLQFSGKGAMIINPSSAWAVAKRDAPQVAEQCWTHGFPIGPKGRICPVPSLLLEHLEFLQDKK